jgi:hypothetical protein
MNAQYTDKQFALIEAMLAATTCSDEEALERMDVCADLAADMDMVSLVICQNALLRIIRRQPD